MESLTTSLSLQFNLHHTNLIQSSHLPLVSFPYRFVKLRCPHKLRSSSNGEGGAADLLRKPVVKEDDDDDDDIDGRKDGWIDWEDQILEDTVPLVGFVRMILHSGKYASGERLSPEHERTILERLLPHHPESEKKIGCGVSYITVGYHPDFESSRCLFIVRTDGEMVDFSYWKCIKGFLILAFPYVDFASSQ
nr:protein DCL, chloroplastic [Tanacetum cinerariifolium]